MSDLSSMNREIKKRQLRRQVIDPHAAPPGGVRPGGVGNGLRDEEDEEEIVHKAEQKVKRKRLRIILTVVVVIGVLAFVGYRYLYGYQYKEYDILWETKLPAGEGSFVQYELFGDNILKVTKDGATYFDKSGKPVWTEGFEMKSPICYVNGDYAAIADRQGNSIYICNTEGCQGVATTLLPILKVSVSAYGVAAAIVEDANSTYVMFYKKDGSDLDWTIKTNMSGDGFLTDISLSPEGTQVMVSDVYLDKSIKNRVVFYNFSEYGKKYADRMVGGFHEEYESSMLARVRFLTEKYACAFADDSLHFFSLENVTSPTPLSYVKVEEKIRSICYSDQYVGIIVDNVSGENNYRMDFYKADGAPVFSKEFSYQYLHVDIDGDMVILYNENSCRVYNMSGKEKFAGDFDFTVSKVTAGRFPNTLIVTSPDSMREIKLN